jgi:hypothetical protein
VNAGSAESKNFDNEFVAFIARWSCGISICCLLNRFGSNGEGLL